LPQAKCTRALAHPQRTKVGVIPGRIIIGRRRP
jgi:hypothetical protein